MQPAIAYDLPVKERFAPGVASGRRWRQFNRGLDEAMARLPNETVIEACLDMLLAMPLDNQRIFWLCLLRIAEMALVQAGNYADACEFEAAGDLLANPRRIELQLDAQPARRIKPRHGAISDSFTAATGTRPSAIWLAEHVTPHICQAALLPALRSMLASSNVIVPACLDRLDRGMQKVAGTIGFLCAWQQEQGQEVIRRRPEASAADKQLLTRNLCRFDRQQFDEMGEDIEQICAEGGVVSRFLV